MLSALLDDSFSNDERSSSSSGESLLSPTVEVWIGTDETPVQTPIANDNDDFLTLKMNAMLLYGREIPGLENYIVA